MRSARVLGRRMGLCPQAIGPSRQLGLDQNMGQSVGKVRIMGARAPVVAATAWVPAAHAKYGHSGGSGTMGVTRGPGCDPQDHCRPFRRDSLAPAWRAAAARFASGIRPSAAGMGWA